MCLVKDKDSPGINFKTSEQAFPDIRWGIGVEDYYSTEDCDKKLAEIALHIQPTSLSIIGWESSLYGEL